MSALTEAGYLAALVPEEYGGSGLPLSAGSCGDPRGVAARGLRRHRANVHDGDSPEARQRRAKEAVPAENRVRGAAPSGIRRHRARERLRHGLDRHLRRTQRRPLCSQRAKNLDVSGRPFRPDADILARTTPKDEVERRTDGMSVFLVDISEASKNGLSIRPLRTMINHSTTEVFLTNVRVPFENLIGHEGEGFRYVLSGMNAERILIAAECIGDAKWFIDRATAYARERIVFGRPIGQNQGRAVSDRASLCSDARRGADGRSCVGSLLVGGELRCRGQHGEDACRGHIVGCRGGVPAAPTARITTGRSATASSSARRCAARGITPASICAPARAASAAGPRSDRLLACRPRW